MAAHELDVFSLTDIAEIQQAYAQIHLHEVFIKDANYSYQQVYKGDVSVAKFVMNRHVCNTCLRVSGWPGGNQDCCLYGTIR